MTTYRDRIAETAEKLAGHPIRPNVARAMEAWLPALNEITSELGR